MATFLSLLTLLAPACHASVILSTGGFHSFSNVSSTQLSLSSSSSGSSSSSSISIPLSTGVSSTVVSTGSSSSSSSIRVPLSTGASSSSSSSSSVAIPLSTGVSSSSSSSSSIRVPLSTGVSGSSSSSSSTGVSPSVPLSTGVSSSSSSSISSSSSASTNSTSSASGSSSYSSSTGGSSSSSSSGSLSSTPGSSSSSTSSSSSSNTSPDPTPVSSPAPTVDVPTTTVTGAAETSAASNIGPLLLYIWQNRDWLNDDDNKQQYIDDVQKTDDDVKQLLGNLPNAPEPPSECGSTAAKKRSVGSRGVTKRSFISGVTDALSDIATAVSCAEKITGNLVNTVTSTPIDTDVVASLTDALKDVSDKIKDDEDDNQSSESQSSQSSTSSSSSSCTASTAVPSCIETISLSTLFNSASGTTSSSVKTITTSSCTTITACSATATTEFTTVSTASSTASAEYTPCEYQCLQSSACGYPSAAARRRNAAPTPDSAKSFAKRELPALATNAVAKRTLTPAAAIDNKAQYVSQKASGDGELDWGFINFDAVSNHFSFDATSSLNKWMQGVLGCTAIAIVSPKGFWWTHLMEPGFIDSNADQNRRWNSIVNALTNGDAKVTSPASLAGPGGILEPSDDNPVKIFLFSRSDTIQYDDNFEPLPAQPRYPNKINQIMGILKTNNGAPFPNAEEDLKYYEWPNEDTPDEALGKLVFEYDPEGTTDNTCQAAYRLWRYDQPVEGSFAVPASNANKAKRQACSLSSSASASSSSTSISASASSTAATTTSSNDSSASSTPASSSSSVYSTSMPSNSSSPLSSSSAMTSTTLSTSTTSSASSTTSTETASSLLPYSPVGSTGPNQNNRCHVHVWEYQLTSAGDDLAAQIQVWDAAGTEILSKTGVEYIDDNSHTWDCPLDNGMELSAQASFDRVNFASGSVVFDSNSYARDFWCNTGGWATQNSDEKERQMDCYFHCPWVYKNGTVYPEADTLEWDGPDDS